jgi:hypothetical protein
LTTGAVEKKQQFSLFFSLQQINKQSSGRRMSSSGILSRVALVSKDISEEYIASIARSISLQRASVAS